MGPTPGLRESTGCEDSDRPGLRLLAYPRVWLPHSLAAGHCPPVSWLDRGVHCFLELRLPFTGSYFPSHREGASMAMIIGIDLHKSTHTATAIGPNAEILAQIRVRADCNTHDRLRRLQRNGRNGPGRWKARRSRQSRRPGPCHGRRSSNRDRAFFCGQARTAARRTPSGRS